MVTYDTYGHLFPQARPEAAAKLERGIFAGRRRDPQFYQKTQHLEAAPSGLNEFRGHSGRNFGRKEAALAETARQFAEARRRAN